MRRICWRSKDRPRQIFAIFSKDLSWSIVFLDAKSALEQLRVLLAMYFGHVFWPLLIYFWISWLCIQILMYFDIASCDLGWQKVLQMHFKRSPCYTTSGQFNCFLRFVQYAFTLTRSCTVLISTILLSVQPPINNLRMGADSERIAELSIIASFPETHVASPRCSMALLWRFLINDAFFGLNAQSIVGVTCMLALAHLTHQCPRLPRSRNLLVTPGSTHLYGEKSSVSHPPEGLIR